LQIKQYKGDYDKTEFYSLMGKYFAEKQYQKEMPYLVNRKTNVWFLAFESKTLVAFAAINELKNKIVLEHSFAESEYRHKGIWKKLNEVRLKYAAEVKQDVEVITKEDHLKKYWLGIGFSEYKKSGSYCYLRRDKKDARN